MAEEIERLGRRDEQLQQRIQRLAAELDVLRSRHAAVKQAQETSDPSSIDYAADQRKIEGLRLEQKTLEEKNDTVQLLKRQLAEAELQQAALQASHEAAVKQESRLEEEIKNGERLIANARAELKNRESEGVLVAQSAVFSELECCFADAPLDVATLFDREREFKDTRHSEAERIRSALEPLQGELSKSMNRFLREFPDERADLEAHVDYLDSFLELRQQIQREDLPRHEDRFKQRLNEKVIQEIGLLNGALQSERSEIVSKIELLNQSLRQLEYRPGTYMELEPRPVRDREITEFLGAIKECLAGTFEGTLEADEARYLRIEKLIVRLREEQRWRDKVTDVRRWFDFAARETDAETGQERGYYIDGGGKSGGGKAKLAFTILAAAIAYQYDIDSDQPKSDRFHFVVVDEMFSNVGDQYAEYALELFQRFGLQLLIVSPLDAKARITEPYVGCYLHVIKNLATSRSEIFSMTAREFEEAVDAAEGNGRARAATTMSARRPR